VLTTLTAKLMSKGIGPSIDHMAKLREDKRELEAKIKTIEAEYASVEAALLSQLEDQGMNKATGKTATASITSTVVGNLVDATALHKYIKRTGHFHLLQQRLSDPACRELFESKGPQAIPGVEPFTKKRVNLRVL
jgi:hypothetical protein